MSCSAGNPPVELALAVQQAPTRPQAIEVEGECDAEAWSRELGVPVERVPPANRAEPTRLELLQYELAPQVVNWRAARLPLALAALCLLTWIVGLNVEAWLLWREANALRAQINADFREAFPRVPVVLDAAKQMRQGVAELKSGAGAGSPRDFLPLTAGLARAFPNEADVVRKLDYRGDSLRAELEPRALDWATKRSRPREPRRRRPLRHHRREHPHRAGFAMKRWWTTLSLRERTAVLAAAGLVFMALLILVAIEPAWRARARLTAELPRLQAEAAEVRALALEAKRLKGRALSVESPEQTRAAVARLLAEKRLEPTLREAEGRLVYSVKRADAAAWVGWLNEVASALPLRVTSAQVTRAGPGVVDAEVALAPAGSK